MKQTKITKIEAREILDSRGNPTLETTVWSGDVSGTASVPSGASVGSQEALELRDHDPDRYAGLDVTKAIHNVNQKIAGALQGHDALSQEQVDQTMIALDGTSNKANLGANSILSVSLAAARLAANLEQQELYLYLADHYGYKVKHLPIPLFNVINGGKHADSGLDIQEYFLIPQHGPFHARLRMATEVYHVLKTDLAEQGYSVGLGDEGGFAPHLKSDQAAFDQLVKAIKDAGYHLITDFRLGIDAAADTFYNADKNKYEFAANRTDYKSPELYKLYQLWSAEYHLQIIEDGCAEDDFDGWKLLTEKLGESTVLVGDDLFVTNPERIEKGIVAGIANAVLIKPNQIGTLTETLAAIKLAQQNHYQVVISHRSGETLDSFISDLAVAVNAEFMKAGAPARGERLAKYNRLLAIESQLS